MLEIFYTSQHKAKKFRIGSIPEIKWIFETNSVSNDINQELAIVYIKDFVFKWYITKPVAKKYSKTPEIVISLSGKLVLATPWRIMAGDHLSIRWVSSNFFTALEAFAEARVA